MGAKKRVTPTRVVLDTNVLVSALIFSAGRLGWLRRAWQSGLVLPLCSKASVLELLRVLSYPKFKLDRPEQQSLLDSYLPWCETVAIPKNVEVPDCRDAEDRKFLELAIVGDARFLVTGDDDLLSISVRKVQIISPASLRELIGYGG